MDSLEYASLSVEDLVVERNQALKKEYTVTQADLPLSCPMPNTTLWNAHPRVFLPIEEKGEAVCPYCSAHFTLKKEGSDA